MHYSVYYIRNCPHSVGKIALNHNARSAIIVIRATIINNHTCEIINFISGGKIYKTLHLTYTYNYPVHILFISIFNI